MLGAFSQALCADRGPVCSQSNFPLLVDGMLNGTCCTLRNAGWNFHILKKRSVRCRPPPASCDYQDLAHQHNAGHPAAHRHGDTIRLEFPPSISDEELKQDLLTKAPCQ